MKKMKKILSVVLTLAMVLGMSVTTFAETSTPGTPGVTETPATGKSGDTGKITIGGFALEDGEVPSGLTISAYQVVKAVYANNQTVTDNVGRNDGSFSNYAPVYGESAVGKDNVINTEAVEDVKDPNKLPEIKISESQLTAVWNHIVKSADNVASDACNQINTAVTASNTEKKQDGTFSVTLTGLKVGSYLIVISGSESKIYNPIVASIYYKVNANNTGSVLDEADFVIVPTDSWVKVTDNPTVDKNIVTTTGEGANQTTTITNHGSTDIGKEIKYQVVINPIPGYGGEHPVLNIVDTLSKGLAFKTGSVAVDIYEAAADLTNATTQKYGTLAADKYTVTPETVATTGATKLTIDFVKDGVYNLGGENNTFVGKKAVITYIATLTDAAAMNESGNENDVTLNYTRDSRVDADDPTNPPTETDKDKTYSYSFDIDGGAIGTDLETTLTQGILKKTGETYIVDEDTQETDDALNGAEFTLYTSNPDNLPEGTTLDDIIYKRKTAEGVVEFDGKVVSAGGGRLAIRGLAAGTPENPAKYYLKETKAPDDYSLNAHVFEIAIAATYHTEDSQTKVPGTLPDGTAGQVPQYRKGELASWTITIDGKTTNTFTVNHEGNTTTKEVWINGDKDGEINDLDIKNTKIASLPSTGGIGTTIFTFGGCAIMILAAALYFISRRKSAR